LETRRGTELRAKGMKHQEGEAEGSSKVQKGCNTTRSTVVPLLSTDSGSIGLDFEVRMGFGIFPMIWSHPSQSICEGFL
jgi:hypothetical protein